MNRRTIILSLLVAIAIVVAYKYVLSPRTGQNIDEHLSIEVPDNHLDPFLLIQFDNGYAGSLNYQHHAENIKQINLAIQMMLAIEIEDKKYLDSLYMAKFMLQFYISESYSQSFKLCTRFLEDLYIAPPPTTTNPKLPLRFTKNFLPTAHKIVLESLPFISGCFHQRMPLHQVLELVIPEITQKGCGSEGNQGKRAIIQDDNQAFVLDPVVFASLSRCYSIGALNTYLEHVEGQSPQTQQYFASSLKFCQLLASEKLFKHELLSLADHHFIQALHDSSSNLLFIEDIVNTVADLVYLQIIDQDEGQVILGNADFPYSDILLDLLISERSGKDKGLDLQELPSIEELINLQDPVLTPMLVMSLAANYERNGFQEEASIIINSFWFDDANTFPVKTWWFNNYPKFLIASYAMGRLDGGQLPLWVSSYFSIANGDEGLMEVLELAKYYNMVVFPKTPAQKAIPSQPVDNSQSH